MNTNSHKNILVTGSLAFDHIMDFPQSFEENIIPEKIKALSVSFLAENFSKNFGGVAGNIAYNLSLLRQKAIIFSSAGKRDFGPYEKHLRKVGVDMAVVNQVDDEFTANMFMITDKNNCQIAGFYPGGMSDDSRLSIKSSKRAKSCDFIVVSPTVPAAMEKFIKEAKSLGVPYLFDPAQQIPRLTPEQLREGIDRAEILICNDYELTLITRKTGLSEKQILSKVKILVTTLGEKGSRIETKDQKIMAKTVKPRQIVDPTGAGDGYIAGFLAGYLNGYPLKTCGQIGATVGTYAVEQYGTQKHKFNIIQFKKRYQAAFKEAIVL
ncbi:carbohydrate kinase family protein [Candidatus Microgenomates bacterium]|nr:carbohydrate kinase family protein [Candidatus Microgenomates bacterium]